MSKTYFIFLKPVKIRVMRNLILTLLLCVLAIACAKERDDTFIEEEPFLPITNLEIESLSVSIGVDMPFSCEVNGVEYSSYSGGIIIMKNLLLDRVGNLVIVKSDGYFDEIRYVIPRLGGHHHMEVQLSKINEDNFYCKELDGFKAEEGGVISSYKIVIDIEPNSIVDKEGNVFTGQVNVFACNIFNGAYVSHIRKFPQNYYVDNEVLKKVNVGGGINVLLLDNSDNRLYLKKGVVLNIQSEPQDPTQAGIPDEMNIIYFDEQTNTWEEKGLMEKDVDNVWKGQVDVLGMIVWGTSHQSKVAKIRFVSDEGLPIPNKYVWVLSELAPPLSRANTDKDGIAYVHIPLNQDFEILNLDIRGTNLFETKEFSAIGPSNEFVEDLGDFVLDSENYQVYTGSVINCDDEVIKESAILMNTYSNSFGYPDYKAYYFSDENGNYQIPIFNTNDNPIRMKAYNLENGDISDEFPIWNYEEPIVDFEMLKLCN